MNSLWRRHCAPPLRHTSVLHLSQQHRDANFAQSFATSSRAYRLRARSGLTYSSRSATSLAAHHSGMADSGSEVEPQVRNRTQQSPLASQRAKEAAAAGKEQPKKGRFEGVFPMSYRESFNQWWANVPGSTAEHNVLSFIPYLQSAPTQTDSPDKIIEPTEDGEVKPPGDGDLHPTESQSKESKNDPYGRRIWRSELVKLSGKNRALNEFSVERVGEQTKHNLVVIHGYGAGLGFFYKNFEGMSRPKGWRLYALDLLGMGRSTRPPFRIKAKTREGKIAEAEDWFVDSLEEWRKSRRLERFTLLGHSLGGYMAVAYALKYPGHLEKLILASPVGVPEDPYAVKEELPEPSESTMQAEFTQDQQATAEGAAKKAGAGDKNNFLNARSDAEADAKAGAAGGDQSATPQRRPLPKWLTVLWDANVSPFSLVRWTGPLGPRFVSGWTSRRFAHLPRDESEALHTYTHALFRQRGSGEYALAYVLAPGAFARSPLIRRVGGVGQQYIRPVPAASSAAAGGSGDQAVEWVKSTSESDEGRKKEPKVPVVFVYGENDWMDVSGGFAAKEKIQEQGGEAKVMVVKNAGHHVYLDGWEDFNDLMRIEMKDTERRAEQ